MAGAWLLGVLILAPALTQPLVAIGLVAALIAMWLASTSVALPLALAGTPTLISAIVGKNPLPKGSATFLIGAWVGLGILLVILRGDHVVALRGTMTLPVLLAVLLLGLMLLRLGTSPDESYGSTKVQLYVADNLVFLIGAVFVGATERGLRIFLVILLAVVAAGALLLLAQLVTGAAQQQYSGRYTVAAQQGAINLGRDSSTGALVAIALILTSTRLWLRMAAIAILPVVLVALIAAGSRGPTLAFVLGLGALISLTAVGERVRRRLLIVGAALVLGALVVPVVVPGSAIGRALSAIVGGSGGLSSNGRSHLWSVAWSAFGAHPLIGLGTGGFGALDPEMYPHNIVLEVGVELGIFGLLALVGMLALMFRNLIGLWRHAEGERRVELALLLALMVSALTNAMVSGAIQDNSDLWLWGGLGLGIAARHVPRPRLRQEPSPRVQVGAVMR